MSASSDARVTVGAIGLGNMGAAFAERILAAGYPLVVYARNPDKAHALAARGAVVAESVRDLARRADVLVTSLPDDRAFEEIAEQVLADADRDAILVDTSTVSPEASARVAALAGAASVGYVRAPVSGNPTVVRAGNLSFMVSGPRDAFELAEPVIRAIGPTVYYLGEAEEARVVKLAINLMIAGIAELMSEALVLGEAAGVDRATLLEVMGGSAAGAPFVKYKTEPLLRDDYTATFTTALMEKDIDLVLAFASGAEVELPLAGAMKLLLRAAIDGGHADDDFMALFLQLRKDSGLDAVSGPVSRVGV